MILFNSKLQYKTIQLIFIRAEFNYVPPKRVGKLISIDKYSQRKLSIPLYMILSTFFFSLQMCFLNSPNSLRSSGCDLEAGSCQTNLMFTSICTVNVSTRQKQVKNECLISNQINSLPVLGTKLLLYLRMLYAIIHAPDSGPF